IPLFNRRPEVIEPMLARKSSLIFGFYGLVSAGLLTGCIITGGTGSAAGGGGDTTTGSGGDTTTGGGGDTTTTGSGGASCVGTMGTGTVADCDKMNIAPAQGASNICGDMQMD